MLIALWAFGTGLQAQDNVWHERANGMTRNCKTQYQKAQAIYMWMCENIAYDTEETIKTADDCWMAKKGNHEAYVDMYVKLATAAGVEAKAVFGTTGQDKARTPKNKDIGDHAWVIATCEKGKILMDPTWGAGTVTKTMDEFIISDNPEEWFDVDPYWMIFTHYPKDKADQLLDSIVPERRFKSLPKLYPYLGQYGLDGKMMYELSLQRVRPPIFYETYQYLPWTMVQLRNIPKNRTMIAGQTYEFTLEKIKPDVQIALRSSAGDSLISAAKWVRRGNLYSIQITPMRADSITVMIDHKNAITYIVEVSGFTIADKQQVFFAPGNLRYDLKTKKYVFAAHQYDHPSSTSGKVEYFRWGTGANPTLNDKDIANYAEFTDWGADVKPGKWRTLTAAEWRYLLTRREHADQKVALGTVCGHTGLILLPDIWHTPKGCVFTPGHKKGYATNTYTEKQWEQMERIGAAFLPAVGNLTSDKEWGRNSYGRYWAASAPQDRMMGDAIIFSPDVISNGTDCRSSGLAVRLVKEKKGNAKKSTTPNPTPNTNNTKLPKNKQK